MVADSCVTYGTPEALVCPPCRVTVPFYLRFSVFTFHPYLRIRCFGCCSAPTNSLQRSVWYVPILGTCLWCCLSCLTGLWAFVSDLLPHSPADDLVFAGSCYCQNWVGGLQALSSIVTFVAGDDCLSYIPQLVTRSESLTRSFSSLLLGDVLSRLCGWSCFRPPTMPGQGSPLVSASGQVFVYRSPSPFRVPTAPCSPFSTNAVSFFWGRSLLLLRRLDLRLDPSGLD